MLRGSATQTLTIDIIYLINLLLILIKIGYSTRRDRESGARMLRFLGRGTKESREEHSSYAQDYGRLRDDVTIHTTAYGTQYVLPVDLLFSRTELLKFLDEARAVALPEKEENGT